LYVCSVDWNHQTNKIISSSHDRNVFVWIKGNETWQPQIVNIKSKVGILEVRWSHDGEKFVACTYKKLAIGYWHEISKYWDCSYIKHKSAITTACFDKSGLFVISGGTDSRVYISSAFIEGIDEGKIPEHPLEVVCKF
jgi:WD40 repeat protein